MVEETDILVEPVMFHHQILPEEPAMLHHRTVLTEPYVHHTQLTEPRYVPSPDSEKNTIMSNHQTRWKNLLHYVTSPTMLHHQTLL